MSVVKMNCELCRRETEVEVLRGYSVGCEKLRRVKCKRCKHYREVKFYGDDSIVETFRHDREHTELLEPREEV